METSDDEILENDVEFRDLDQTDTLSEAKAARNSLESYACQEDVEPPEHPEEIRNDEELLVAEFPKTLHGNDEEIDELKDELKDEQATTGQSADAQLQSPAAHVQLQTVSGEYLDCTKQPTAVSADQAPISRSSGSWRKGGGKWAKRKRKNPFISFFLSMYSRRPRQRVAEVARQAGRQWGRMSDSQRKLYSDLRHSQSQTP